MAGIQPAHVSLIWRQQIDCTDCKTKPHNNSSIATACDSSNPAAAKSTLVVLRGPHLMKKQVRRITKEV